MFSTIGRGWKDPFGEVYVQNLWGAHRDMIIQYEFDSAPSLFLGLEPLKIYIGAILFCAIWLVSTVLFA